MSIKDFLDYTFVCLIRFIFLLKALYYYFAINKFFVNLENFAIENTIGYIMNRIFYGLNT